MSSTTNYILGVYDDEDEVLHAVSEVKSKGIKIEDVFTPFPIHGLDRAVGHERTRLPIAAFMFGVLGLACTLSLISYTMVFDWPMIIGGKDFFALPNWIPVSFEGTVLFTAFGLVITFCISNNLYPGNQPDLLDIRITDDKFVMAINVDKNKKVSADDIKKALKDSGAIEVNVK
ncbi:DUF3341 domain-containing protein [Cytophagaceae bacterium 50C-KIRBA]|uniref:DUF3341 domain-containing protein n=1 Tax=Aquirufa beregesia TaxID=2516556 RepID=A0ABX0EU25_9BACT|nr:DUF3341 domain-containing protein [Aquirufa beregesia]NGZ44036.1 DUF3341 domain-containing protein [Aquirufa beregesia]